MDVIERVHDLMNSRGWSRYRLAKKMGKPVNTVSDMLKRKNIPSVATIEIICDAFNITLSEFFAVDGEPVILTKRQSELLEAYSILEAHEKELADAYVFGLARIPKLPVSEVSSENES